MNYTGSNYDTRGDVERAEDLPKDFGYDHPEVIRLVGIRDVVDQEAKAAEKNYREFDAWRCELIGKQEGINHEVTVIDRQRPQLLADLFLSGGDFTRDDEAQQRRADLVQENERFKLAWPLLMTLRQQRVDHLQSVQQRLSADCRAVDDLIRKLRIDHVAAMRHPVV